MLLVGKNYYSAKRLLSDVQAEFEANPQLQHDFGKLVQQGSWEDGNFITATGAAFYALGKGQSPRGMRNGPHRPDYIVLDDADDDEEARNPRRIDDSVNWVYRALLPAMGSEITRFVMVNNRIAPYCILSNLASNPIFKHRRVNAVDSNGNPAWSKYSKEFYERVKKRNLAAWLTEYMNDPQIEGKIFVNEYFQFRPALRLNQYSRIVAYWDIAYSESKSADFNCIPIVGLHGREKHVLKVYCRQSKMEGALRWMSEIQKNLPSTVIIEWYAESQFWSDAVEMAIQKVAVEVGFRLPIIFIDRPGRQTNKYSRIIQMLPDFQNGDVYFNKNEEFNLDMQETIKQIKAIEPGYSGHDDAPDALEGAINKLNPSIISAGTEPVVGYNEMKKRVY